MSNPTVRPDYDPRLISQPPRLHWTVLVVLTAFTRLIFGPIWLAVQANWIKRVTGRGRAFKWSIMNLSTLPILLAAFRFLPLFVISYLGMPRRYVGTTTAFNFLPSTALSILTIAPAIGCLVGVAISIVTAFIVRAELQSDPIGIRLGSLMTFLLGPIYFQYFLEDMPMIHQTPLVKPTAPSA